MLQCSPPPGCKRQNWRKPRQWRSSKGTKLNKIRGRKISLAHSLTTSSCPGILLLFFVFGTTLAARHGRLCFLCHTSPLSCFAAALLPLRNFRKKPTNSAATQFTAGGELTFLFHHVAGSAANPCKLTALSLTDHSLCMRG